jgi:hypothetical protein
MVATKRPPKAPSGTALNKDADSKSFACSLSRFNGIASRYALRLACQSWVGTFFLTNKARSALIQGPPPHIGRRPGFIRNASQANIFRTRRSPQVLVQLPQGVRVDNF